MLRSLHIENYVLIDNQGIEFPEGLVVISGPTGAGKSILIGALGLLLGKKADASVIANGASNCVVEGEFDSPSPQLEALCSENELQYDGGHYIIRRVVASTGRSRAFFNDEPVSSAILERIGTLLVDIHSQHDTLLLTSRSYQLSVLDNYCDNRDLLSECASAWSELGALDSEISRLRDTIAKADSERDYNVSLLSKLEEAKLREGELTDLEAEQFQLANAEQISQMLATSSGIFNSSDEQQRGINAALSALEHELGKLSDYLPQVSPFVSRVASARIELKDISDEIDALCEKADASPQRLQWLDDRLGLLYALMKRHGVDTEAALIERRDSLRAISAGTEQLSEQLEGLLSKRSDLQAHYDELSSQLHQIRVSKAGEFSKSIEDNLHFMELEGAGFSVEFSQAKPGPAGYDEANFLFQPSGARPAPVAKCASGGELSRIMLALKQTMSGFMHMPTMIFDEIDTGVSGSVAARMGSVICNMGAQMQVFAITHLPQVAAKGQAHYLVSKSSESGRAVSTIKKLSPEERVLEVARMLSGTALTPEAIANARALLA